MRFCQSIHQHERVLLVSDRHYPYDFHGEGIYAHVNTEVTFISRNEPAISKYFHALIDEESEQ